MTASHLCILRRKMMQVAAGAAGAVEIGIGNTLWVPQALTA